MTRTSAAAVLFGLVLACGQDRRYGGGDDEPADVDAGLDAGELLDAGAPDAGLCRSGSLEWSGIPCCPGLLYSDGIKADGGPDVMPEGCWPPEATCLPRRTESCSEGSNHTSHTSGLTPCCGRCSCSQRNIPIGCWAEDKRDPC